MATKLKPTIGTMKCLCCGVVMPVKQADTGTLDLSCKQCDFSAYAKAGTEAHTLAMSRITRTTSPAPVQAPAPAPVATPVAPPPAPKRRGIFEL